MVRFLNARMCLVVLGGFVGVVGRASTSGDKDMQAAMEIERVTDCLSNAVRVFADRAACKWRLEAMERSGRWTPTSERIAAAVQSAAFGPRSAAADAAIELCLRDHRMRPAARSLPDREM